MAEPRSAIPHFSVTTVDGRPVTYGSIWQREHLVLLLLPPHPSDALRRYSRALADVTAHLVPRDTACVITTDAIGGFEAPALIIADRWGEVRFVAAGALPRLEDAGASLQHVRMACPECEGEWK